MSSLARVDPVGALHVTPLPEPAQEAILPAVPAGPRLVNPRRGRWRRWTAAEEEGLRRLYRKGARGSAAACAAALGRTRWEILAKARRLLGPGDPNAGEYNRRRRALALGVKAGEGHALPWSPAEDEWLLSEARFLDNGEIARRLGRTVQSVEWRLYHATARGRREENMDGGQPLCLKRLLDGRRISYTQFGEACRCASQSGRPYVSGLSKVAISDLVNHQKWPKLRGVRQAIEAACEKFGIDPRHALKPDKESHAVLPKVSLDPDCLKHFRLFKNPFEGDPRSPEEMWMGGGLASAERRILAAARRSEFLCVVGEPGAGKSLLRRRAEEHLSRDARVWLFHPRFPEMRRVHAGAICSDILRQMEQTVPQDLVARNRRLEEALAAGHRAGVRYAMLVEEAHRWNSHTFSALKNFYELGVGFEHFMGVVMFGQPALAGRLRLATSREVVERADTVELRFNAKDCRDYLEFRCGAAKADLGRILDSKALALVCDRARTPQQANNLALAAMDRAHRLGEPAPVRREVIEKIG